MPFSPETPPPTTQNPMEDPQPTAIDRACAYFVRDALFPLRRDWGSSGRNGKSHGQIHPALMALDRLRTDLIDFRPKSISNSNVFPRGVLLVPQSEALVGRSSNDKSNNSNNKDRTTRTMEYNGQPDVDESTASVEVIPNLLTVKCMRCNGTPFLPGSSKAYMREKPNAWKRADDTSKEQELVVCSDRILQKDYYQTFGNDGEKTGGGQRREDLPVRSMKAVEETLAREITKLAVHSDEDDSSQNPPVSYPSFPPSSSSSRDAAAVASCEAYAGMELLAARAAECLLRRKTDDDTGSVTETRIGSALRPQNLFWMLPGSTQRKFVDRCTLQVATQHTTAAANEAARGSGSGSGSEAPLRPKDCVEKAWANHHLNSNRGSQ